MRTSILSLIFLLFTTIANCQLVIDKGDFLTEQQATQLTNAMQDLRDSSSVESLIYTAMDLDGKTPVEYGIELAKTYPVGMKGVNNGVMILLSKNDRKFQILAGNGLEWNLTDDECQRIVDRAIPFFKEGDFFGGLNKVLELISQQVAALDWEVFQMEDFNRYMTGQVFKMTYSHKPDSEKEIQIPDSSAQFSADAKIGISVDGNPFNLYYSKYMGEMISKIKSSSDVTIYFRLTDFDSEHLELLGVE